MAGKEEKKVPEVISLTERTDDHPWHKPDKDEKRILATSMFFKYLRLILTNIILVGITLFPCFIRISMVPFVILLGLLIIFLIIYANYRRYDLYYLTSSPVDTKKSKVWMIAAISGALTSFMAAMIIGFTVPGELGFLAAIPPTVMLIILQIKDWHILILLAKGKYKIKNGKILSGEKEIRMNDKFTPRSDCSYDYQPHDLTLIISYSKTFCDNGGRTLSVFTDFYTYHSVKQFKHAMFLKFDNGLYVISKSKKKEPES